MKQIENLDNNVRGLLSFTVLQYMLDTIYENPKLAKFFVDDMDNPSCCIVIFHHLVFLGGIPTQDCLCFLSDRILIKDNPERGKIFFLIYPDETSKNALENLLQGNCNNYERSLYVYNQKCVDEFQVCDNVVDITAKLLDSDTENLEMITNEVISTGTYANMEDYLLRGIGRALIIYNKVCGFCTSEYPSKGSIAIGIEVLEEYQRQGYAKAMTNEFLNSAIQRSLAVYWECWKNNTASVNTALSCGFKKVADYPFIFVKL